MSNLGVAIDDLVKPTSLSLLTTFYCTASCKNCCFQCSPKVKERMTLPEIESYVDKMCADFPSIRVVVFSGGECFALKADLSYAIKKVADKGLSTRVVTNGFWAVDYDRAYCILNELKKNGLKEINFSTGDDHQEWVHYDNIVYGCLAARDLGINVWVNVESHSNAKFNKFTFEHDDRISQYIGQDSFDSKQIKISQGIWIPFKTDSKEERSAKQNNNCISVKQYRTCGTMFNTLAVIPSGHVLSCCGLTSLDNPYLVVGNLKKGQSRDIIDYQFDDLLKIWLYVEGPLKILEFLYRNDAGKLSKIDYSMHICEACKIIFSTPQYIDDINNNMLSLLPNILLKYNLEIKNNSHKKQGI